MEGCNDVGDADGVLEAWIVGLDVGLGVMVVLGSDVGPLVGLSDVVLGIGLLVGCGVGSQRSVTPVIGT